MQRERHLAVWLRMLAQMEIRATRGAKNILNSHGKQLKDAFVKGGQTAAQEVINKGKTDWVKFLVANYATTIRAFSAYMFEQLNAKPKKASFLDNMQGFIARNAYRKSEYITETSHEIVKDVVNNGIANGLSENEIGDEIYSHFIEGESVGRARTIARTEVGMASSYAMDEAARETDLELNKEWVATLDARTRPAHDDADGDVVDIDEAFDVDGEDLMYPRDPNGSAENTINCRCTVIYIPKGFDSTGDDSGELL